MNQLLHIVAVDPGVTTGIAVHTVLATTVSQDYQQLEMGPDKHHRELFEFLRDQSPDVLVCERFDYRNVRNKGTEMPGIRLESREYIGVCELYTQMYTDCELQMSPTSNKGDKALISPSKLKGLGLYRAPGGRQHMNDATAHLLHHVVMKLGRRDYLAPLRPTQ